MFRCTIPIPKILLDFPSYSHFIMALIHNLAQMHTTIDYELDQIWSTLFGFRQSARLAGGNVV